MLHKEMYQSIADAAAYLCNECFILRYTFDEEAEKTLASILRNAEYDLNLAAHHCLRKATKED